jgi:multiple sugar transport system permease protein
MMKKIRQIVLLIFLGIAVVLTVFPIWYMLSHSLKSEEVIINVYHNDLAVWDKVFIKPFCIHLGQYYRIFFRTPEFLYLFWNSVFITAFIVVFQVLLGIVAAYGLSKVKFPGSEILFFIYIIVMLMPFQVTLVPNYMVLEKLKLLDKGAALILPGIFGTFGIFFLKQFMEGIDGTFIEEARILGASELQIITDIVGPICKPVITSVAVLLFIDYWNMIEQPLVFITSQEKYPLSVYLSTITSQNISIGFACSVLYMILPMLLMLYAGNDLTDQLKVRSLK